MRACRPAIRARRASIGVGVAFGFVSFPLALFPAGLLALLLGRDKRRMHAAGAA
jgi:hypothetical protein